MKVASPVIRVMQASSFRFALWISAIFIGAVLIAGTISFIVLTDELRQRLNDDARQSATNLATTYDAVGLDGLQSQIATGLKANYDHTNLFLFVDQNGASRFGNFVLAEPFEGGRELAAEVDFTLGAGSEDIGGESFAVYGIKIDAGWVFAGRDTNWIVDTQEILFQAVAWALGAAVTLAIGVAFILARRNEKRIARISATLDAVASGDFSARSDDRDIWHDDIGRIARSQNDMLDRLSLSIESLRQVSNDIAHDLRTPLTRLRSRLERRLMQDTLPADIEAEIAAAVDDTDKIVKTFNAVLRIAQIEGGQAKLGHDPIDLSEVVSDVFELLAPVAEDAGHVINGHFSPAPVLIRGDREMLGQAIQNLIANAIYHLPEPGRIDVLVYLSEGDAVLSVSDNGPGIPGDEQKNVLKRFYRLERSRHSDGNGLGLSLVAAIVRLHGGELKLENNNPGLRASVMFRNFE